MKPEILWSYSQESATAKDLSQLNPIYTHATSFQFILISFSDLRPFSHIPLSSEVWEIFRAVPIILGRFKNWVRLLPQLEMGKRDPELLGQLWVVVNILCAFLISLMSVSIHSEFHLPCGHHNTNTAICKINVRIIPLEECSNILKLTYKFHSTLGCRKFL